MLFTAEQAIADTDLLGRALQLQGGDVTFDRHNLAAADVVGVDPQNFLALRIGVDLALAEDAVRRLRRIEMAAGKDAVTRAAEHTFGIASDDVRRFVEILGLVDDAIA
ncbi:hypothetical protein D3C86_1580600 [compost metagenome]